MRSEPPGIGDDDPDGAVPGADGRPDGREQLPLQVEDERLPDGRGITYYRRPPASPPSPPPPLSASR